MSSPIDPPIPASDSTTTPEKNQSPGNLKMTALEVGLLVSVSVIINTMVGTYSGLKGSYLLKDVLHLSASQVSAMGILIGIPAYIRPFLGTGADLFPLFGFHRRSYYVLSWILYAAALITEGLIPTHGYTYTNVLGLTLAAGLGANLLFVIMDSIMVSIGNRTGTIGRLQSAQQGIPLLMALGFTSHLGGFVAENWSYQRCFLLSGLFAAFGALTTFLVHEKPVDRRYERHPNTLNERHIEQVEDRIDTSVHAKALGKALISPGLWICVLYVFYLILTPGTNTAQFFYSSNVLHFSPQFMGDLGIPGSAGAVVGIALFLLVSKRLPTSAIVWGAFLGDLTAYPLLFLWRDHHSAEIITFITAMTGSIYNLCLLTFAAKVCPKGIEASIYALFMAAVSLAGNLGDNLGSRIYDYYGPAHHHSITYGWYALIVWGIILTAMAAVMVPLLPRWTRDAKVEREQNAAQAAA